MIRRLVLSPGLPLVFVLAACSIDEVSAPLAPGTLEESPSFLISDGAHGGPNPHFYFLPPVVPNPNFSGTFDPALSPTVRICALSGSVCSGPDISTFTLTSSPPISVDGEHYGVLWKTAGLNLSTSVNYRIQVFVGSVLLGFADVDVVGSSQELKDVSAEFVGLVIDKPLNIKFRIEEGIVGQVTVSPSSATIEPGETQQFTATLTDLHGNPLSGPPITWASDNTGVATVDGNGLATGVAEGTATITATSQNASGTATLTVAGAGLGFAFVSAGGFQSCGLTTSGAAYCWGDNLFGTLGNGTNTDSSIPVPVSGSHTFTSVSVGPGNGHACGVTTSGAAYCWGFNGNGELGNGTNTSSNVPVAVSGSHTFASVSAGKVYNCGVTTAGAAYCWGYNGFGQFGNGTNTGSNVPVAVSGSHTFASVNAGQFHSCGVTTAGAAYCWGTNGSGQLGDGTNTDSNVPVAVSGGNTFASVDAGTFLHSCGLTTAGAAYCWGFGFFGAVGNGSNAGSNVPVAVSGSHTFTSVSAGQFHSCGVTTADVAYCWGRNGDGQLGNGTNTNSNVPVAVSGSHAFASVSAGGHDSDTHSCGMTTAGAGYCWGNNSNGQLGNGTNTNSNVPVAVSPP